MAAVQGGGAGLQGSGADHGVAHKKERLGGPKKKRGVSPGMKLGS